MRKFFQIIQTNYFLAIVITLIAYLLYPNIPKYTWLVDSNANSNTSVDFFFDVDNDSRSEYLMISENDKKFGSLSLFNDDNILLNLTNLPYKIFVSNNDAVVFDNKNNSNKIMFLAAKQDSLFLLSIDYSKNANYTPEISKYFLDLAIPFQGDYKFSSKIVLDDINNDGFKDAIVMVTAGYTLQPRRIYNIDIEHNTILKSPITGAAISDFIIYDFDNDGKKEIILNTTAYCNISESRILEDTISEVPFNKALIKNKDLLLQYSDCNAWFIVLDYQLNYKFTPVKIEGWTSTINSLPYTLDGKQKIISVYSNYQDSTIKPHILIHSIDGKLESNYEIKTKIFPPVSLLQKNGNYFITDQKKQSFKIIGPKEIEKLDGAPNENIESKSVLSKLENGIIFFQFTNNNLVIDDATYHEIGRFFFPNISKGYKFISKRTESKDTETFLLDTSSYKIKLLLKKNPFYTFRFILLILTYILSFIILELIKRIYSYQAIREKKRFEKIVKEKTDEVKKQKEDLERLTSNLQEKNDEVFQQNIEIEKRREEIETLYEKISTSITYGKGIKDTLLPTEEIFNSIFQESFIMFEPKNVVGGDFYWISEINNRKIMIVGDTSGEGISGGFLSLFAVNLLNNMQIDDSTKASSILKKVNQSLSKQLSSYLTQQNDGIEMAVLIIESGENDLFNINFASANIPLHYFPSDKIIAFETIEPNDYAIRADINNASFKDHYIQLPKSSMLYLATKGIYLQKGADSDQVYGKTHLRSNLMRINVLPIDQQKEIFIDKFNQWKKSEEQTDDVLCIGIRI